MHTRRLGFLHFGKVLMQVRPDDELMQFYRGLYLGDGLMQIDLSEALMQVTSASTSARC